MRMKPAAMLVSVALLSLAAGIALADYPVRDGNGVLIQIKSFTCEAIKVCAVHVPIKSDGTELFTSVQPGFIAGTVNVAQAIAANLNATVTGSVAVTNVNTNGQKTMTGSSPVVIASDQSPIPVTMGGTDPCQAVVKTYTPISMTTATTTRIVAPVAAKRTYVCSLVLYAGTADNVAVIEGTGGTCGTATAGVIGGTTAANGINIAANGGLSWGNGAAAIAATAGANVDLCLITSSAGPLAGHLAWVQQ